MENSKTLIKAKITFREQPTMLTTTKVVFHHGKLYMTNIENVIEQICG
jgi:hypothetical protein